MEYQAIVMAAGKGSRMSDLTTHSSKSLLPIANRPMVWYPVNMLAKAGFTEAIMVVAQTEEALIRKALVDLESSIKLDYVTIPDEDDLGTAESLRMLKPKIHRDMLVVSCDLITDLSLHQLADVHRTNDATVTILLAPALDTSEMQVPGSKANRKIERELVGVDKKGSRVLFISSMADLEEDLSFRKSFFKKFPYVNMKTQLTDAHMYLMKKSVLDILDQNSSNSISTIRGELIPHLVKRQTQVKNSSMEADQTDIVGEEKNTEPEEDLIMQSALEMSTWSDRREDVNDVTCYAYTMEGRLCLRANSLIAYCEANRVVPRQLQSLTKETDVQLIHPQAKISNKTQSRPGQTGSDSMVGDGTALGEKCSVKHSVIGSHCKISDKNKITNSVIMNGVTIKEGCQITGCVVCENAVIEEKCELKDCIVGASQQVKAASKYTSEALVVDQMMEI